MAKKIYTYLTKPEKAKPLVEEKIRRMKRNPKIREQIMEKLRQMALDAALSDIEIKREKTNE